MPPFGSLTKDTLALWIFAALTGLFCWVIKEAFRTLTNHFKHDEARMAEIASHMQKTNTLLDLLVQKVVLRDAVQVIVKEKTNG
jgi:hypothetical protein